LRHDLRRAPNEPCGGRWSAPRWRVPDDEGHVAAPRSCETTASAKQRDIFVYAGWSTSGGHVPRRKNKKRAPAATVERRPDPPRVPTGRFSSSPHRATVCAFRDAPRPPEAVCVEPRGTQSPEDVSIQPGNHPAPGSARRPARARSFSQSTVGQRWFVPGTALDSQTFGRWATGRRGAGRFQRPTILADTRARRRGDGDSSSMSCPRAGREVQIPLHPINDRRRQRGHSSPHAASCGEGQLELERPATGARLATSSIGQLPEWSFHNKPAAPRPSQAASAASASSHPPSRAVAARHRTRTGARPSARDTERARAATTTPSIQAPLRRWSG